MTKTRSPRTRRRRSDEWPEAVALPGDPRVLRLSSREEHLAALPYQLGYVPVESLVLMGQVDAGGGRLQSSGTARHDLPPLREDGSSDPGHETAIAGVAASHLAAMGADAVVVAVWTDQEAPPDGPPPFAGTATAAAGACREQGLRVVDVLVNAAGWVRSLWCDDPVCCPAEGVALPDPTTSPALAALAQVTGEPRDSRQALVDRFDGEPAEVLRSRFALLRAEQHYLDLGDDEAARDAWLGGAGDVLADAVTRRLDDEDAVLDDDDLGLVALAFDVDLRVRDAAVGAVVADADRRHALREVLTDAARRLDDDLDAGVLAVVALLALCSGDGTGADVASRRALSHQPGQSLSGLVQASLDRAMPPDELVHIWSTPFDEVPADVVEAHEAEHGRG